MVAVQLLQHLFLQCKRYNYSFALYGNAIDHCHSLLNWPNMLHALFLYLFLYCQPCIMYNLSLWRPASSWVAAWISSIDMHIGIFTDVLMACMFMFMSVISWSLCSVWLFQDNQSAIERSGSGLYIMQTLYW